MYNSNQQSRLGLNFRVWLFWSKCQNSNNSIKKIDYVILKAMSPRSLIKCSKFCCLSVTVDVTKTLVKREKWEGNKSCGVLIKIVFGFGPWTLWVQGPTTIKLCSCTRESFTCPGRPSSCRSSWAPASVGHLGWWSRGAAGRGSPAADAPPGRMPCPVDTAGCYHHRHCTQRHSENLSRQSPKIYSSGNKDLRLYSINSEPEF